MWVQTSVPQTYHRRGFGARGFETKAPSRWSIWVTFRMFLEPFSTTKFLRFESKLKIFSLFTIQV